MSREIKFRVWDPRIGRYRNRDEWAITSDGQPLRYFESGDGGYDVSGAEGLFIEQFTGLKDRNDKDIYEGDIVRETYHENNPYGYCPEDWDKHERVFVVEYHAPSFNLVEEYGDGGQRVIRDFAFEVVGNVHENPDLLKT